MAVSEADAEGEGEVGAEPTPEQLAEAEAEGEGEAEGDGAEGEVVMGMESQRRGDPTLSRYFREMAAHRVLTAEEEANATRELERLETARWRALLGYPPAFEAVARVFDVHLGESVPPEIAALRERAACDGPEWDAAVHSLALRLRALDRDRLVIREAERAAEGIADGTPAVTWYLAHVRRARHAHVRARNRFVAAYLRLVLPIARRYDRGLLPLPDLIQEGNLGLLLAVDRFDHRLGYRFSTYATWWVRHAIRRAIADKGRAVRIPVYVDDARAVAVRATRAFATRTGREPTSEELAIETGIAADKLDAIMGYSATVSSLHRPVLSDEDDDGLTFIDLLADESVPSPYDALAHKRAIEHMRQILATLSPMDAGILRYRFGLDGEDEFTLKETGEKYNLSRERIRQLQELTLAVIRCRIAD